MSQSDREYQKKQDAHNADVKRREDERARKDQAESKAFQAKMAKAATPAGKPSSSTSGGRSTCFPAGTLVQTPVGSVPIEQLNRGDRVIAGHQPSVWVTGCLG